jgi:selenophosphate synthetase-related protein
MARSRRRRFCEACATPPRRLLTSFDAKAGEVLVAAIDLRGRYREPFSNWEAATEAPGARLRGDLELLPEIAEAGLSRAAKDISQGGIIGTATMLAECSGVGIAIDVRSVPRPEGVPVERWLLTFPSYGYLLAVAPSDVGSVVGLFSARGLSASAIGAITADRRVVVTDGVSDETIWDFARAPLIGCGIMGTAA